jgi:uncharacterized protein
VLRSELAETAVSALVLFAGALLALAAPACSPSPRATATAYLEDRAGILETETAANINRRLEAFEKETCHRLFLLILSSLPDGNLEAFNARIMQERGIAVPPLESGLILTVALAEGKVRIDAGKGLQGIVNSGRADEILKTAAIPLFAEEKYSEGLIRALMLLMDEGRLIDYPDGLRPDICR